MSVCVTVKTKKVIEPDDIFRSLADNGENIVVTSHEFPCLKFGSYETDRKSVV